MTRAPEVIRVVRVVQTTLFDTSQLARLCDEIHLSFLSSHEASVACLTALRVFYYFPSNYKWVIDAMC